MTVSTTCVRNPNYTSGIFAGMLSCITSRRKHETINFSLKNSLISWCMLAGHCERVQLYIVGCTNSRQWKPIPTNKNKEFFSVASSMRSYVLINHCGIIFVPFITYIHKLIKVCDFEGMGEQSLNKIPCATRGVNKVVPDSLIHHPEVDSHLGRGPAVFLSRQDTEASRIRKIVLRL